ncbi:MAG: PilZ domain-containing protein [Aquificaceae bacterium]|nr:PilZ domain-containing protein [Aquificaceae bacterium]MDW8423117.1 PilZ domain-containing protein [Aquificaceae bacterium]
MKYQGGFETFREATKYMFEAPSVLDVVFVLLGLSLAIGLLIVFPYWWSKYRARVELRREFFNSARIFGLSQQETNLLWRCAGTAKEPMKILQSKAVFERCVSKLVKEDLSKIELITSTRKKLKFDSIPWFLPLSSTRDIDLYQTGFVTYNNMAYGAAVWEKSESELHIAFLDTPGKIVSTGEKVKFSFLREGDGRYYFYSQVIRTYRDGNKLVLVLPHTDQLSKIQLRDSLRWKVKIPAKVFIYTDDTSAVFEEPEYIVEATVEDISTQGVKICLHALVEVKIGQRILVNFELKSYPIKVLGTVKNIRGSTEKTCVGVRFENLGKPDEDYIRKFIIDEQRELLKAYKTGEPKEGSSS